VQREHGDACEKCSLGHRREFELSSDVPGDKPVPGAVLMTTERTQQRAVFFLGYEERRLDVALDEPLVVSADTAVVFGVPAFNAGWEMDAFAKSSLKTDLDWHCKELLFLLGWSILGTGANYPC
jgi:hypothetical protein